MPFRSRCGILRLSLHSLWPACFLQCLVFSLLSHQCVTLGPRDLSCLGVLSLALCSPASKFSGNDWGNTSASFWQVGYFWQENASLCVPCMRRGDLPGWKVSTTSTVWLLGPSRSHSEQPGNFYVFLSLQFLSIGFCHPRDFFHGGYDFRTEMVCWTSRSCAVGPQTAVLQVSSRVYIELYIS